MNKENADFYTLFLKVKDFGQLSSRDLTALVLPLLHKAQDVHDKGLVLGLHDFSILEYTGSKLDVRIPNEPCRSSEKKLFTKPKNNAGITVSSVYKGKSDDTGYTRFHNQNILAENEEVVDRAVYTKGYRVWDMALGHYDPLSEIHVLGLMLASLAYQLNFDKIDELETFVENRESLYYLNQDLHPTIHHVIAEMTELYREDRPQNLELTIAKLSNYQDFNPENYKDLSNISGFKNKDIEERDLYILDKLKRRLFDISRRNKLLHFKQTSSFINLTEASVPILLDHNNIKETDLIYWESHIKNKLKNKGKLSLNRYLDFELNRFIGTSLNKIRLGARRNRIEYGFDQLRLVVAFLHWYNYKENREERISSPLLLMPVKLEKKKGIKDQYNLIQDDFQAEINPVLSFYLKDLYDINLPDFIDLNESKVSDLVANIKQQMLESSEGISLEWKSKPSIKIIHRTAKRNFRLKQKRSNRRRDTASLSNLDHSYDVDNFKPMGYELYKKYLKNQFSSLEFIINEDISAEENATAEKKRAFYAFDNQGANNPLVWEVDTCNTVLGNFKYRKMSLVRDYDQIIQSKVKDSVFEELFNEEPKAIIQEEDQLPGIEDLFPIIDADPTQQRAVVEARNGSNYIIQGPPGTGKSQTITNLIADYVARGKKVLFVCEKRAALDVVYSRLEEENLAAICSLIHDSQADKKEFIMDLKEVYEDFIKDPHPQRALNQAKEQRNQIAKDIAVQLAHLDFYHDKMRAGQTPLYTCVQFLISLAQEYQPLPDEQLLYVPNYSQIEAKLEFLKDWESQIQNHSLGQKISDYPLIHSNQTIIKAIDAQDKILSIVKNIEAIVSKEKSFIESILAKGLNLQELFDHVAEAITYEDMISSQKLAVLDPNSALGIAVDKDLIELQGQENKLEKQEEVNKNWKTKFSETETGSALNQWQNLNSSFFKFLMPKWYALKKTIASNYNFDAHQVKPEYKEVLANLAEEYKIKNEIVRSKSALAQLYAFPETVNTPKEWLEQQRSNPSPILRSWLKENDPDYLKDLLAHSASIKHLSEDLISLFDKQMPVDLERLSHALDSVKAALPSLSAFSPNLLKYHKMSAIVKQAIATNSWAVQELSFHAAYRSLWDSRKNNPAFARHDAASIEVHANEAVKSLKKYYKANVDYILAKTKNLFMEKVHLSEKHQSQLDSDEKQLRKDYREARKILENEFGKKMRYKSIRELSNGPAQVMLNSLKPVWLMSPLSVSDTMPINPDTFDVIIFDEASQITVEEGVPALFRTHQSIIVGDQMQMPPTNFFSTQVVEDEEESDELAQRIGFNLDADSLLNQGARKLKSLMLGWHYRSRRENLIGFSNSAFYKRQLLTIPDVYTTSERIDPLPPVVSPDQQIDLQAILDRGISYQYLENAVYHKRSNHDEARYIAQLVRKLLLSRSPYSIGLVAFSQEQQSTIEVALEHLAAEDREFASLLEAAFAPATEDNSDHDELFVKNLENVQGDERDIIIISTCYGFNNKGKMYMNFGPINRRGGEKRLNVIFTRAKQHMVIVSSIKGEDIKNDYNEGANYFKKFLQYAERISNKDLPAANGILNEFSTLSSSSKEQHDYVQKAIKAYIQKQGFNIDLNVGQSHFTLDLAIKTKDNLGYQAAVILDNENHYKQSNTLEQYGQKPAILRAFGWKTLRIMSRDWFENPNTVKEHIDRFLKQLK